MRQDSSCRSDECPVASGFSRKERLEFVEADLQVGLERSAGRVLVITRSCGPAPGIGVMQNGAGTMSSPCQLATMIETVAPHLDSALACRDNVDSILAIARVVPSWQCAGFECRLGDAAPRADFGVHLRRKHICDLRL